MTIGITGAGGQLGGALLRYAAGWTGAASIIAVTRNPQKVDSGLGVQVRAGDFNDASGLRAAFEGVERLVIVPTSDLSPGVRTRQHTHAIQAAKDAGVQHVIYISTVSPRPDPENTLFNSHFDTEQALIGSGLNWTILRMSVYMDTLVDPAKRAMAAGTYSAVPGAPAAYVTRDDIAATAAGILCTPGHVGITYHATGPASVSQQEVADIIGRVTGKAIAFSAMTQDQHQAGLEAAGLPGFLVNGIVGFYAGLRAGAFDLVTGDVDRLGGRPAEGAEHFLGRMLKA